MRAGQLDRRIFVERATEKIDEFGVPEIGWDLIATMRAQVVTASADEFMGGAGASTETRIVFRTRFVDGINLDDRIRFDDPGSYSEQFYDIKGIEVLGRRRGLELRTIGRLS